MTTQIKAAKQVLIERQHLLNARVTEILEEKSTLVREIEALEADFQRTLVELKTSLDQIQATLLTHRYNNTSAFHRCTVATCRTSTMTDAVARI